MGWSLEGRVPFLDHRVVEFGLALPDRLKTDRNQGKIFLKRWARKYLPDDHLFGPKLGFYVPIGEWIGVSFITALAEILPKHPAIQAWFRPEGVRQLLKTCRGSSPAIRMVWTLLQFAIWYQMFVDGPGERPPVRLDPLAYLSA